MTVLLLIITIAALGYVLIDRSSRAEAWRRIAEERRWNSSSGTPATRDPDGVTGR